MNKRLLVLSLGAIASVAFGAPAQAGYKWESGRGWVLSSPCSLGQAIWCACASNCTAGSGCNFAMGTAPGPNNTVFTTPKGLKIYVPKGTKAIAPNSEEQATKK